MLVVHKPALSTSIWRQINVSSFHTTAVTSGKAAKRRKMTRIEKSPNLTSTIRAVPKTPSMSALEHFDDFYRKIFGTEWHSIRLALLSKSKFCALISNFTDKEAVSQELSQAGCFSIREHYESELASLKAELDPDLLNQDSVRIGPKIERPQAKVLSEEEEADLIDEVVHYSMSPELAEGRVIQPEGAVLGGGTGQHQKLSKSSSMYLHVPSVKLRGMEDFVEETEYYESYQKVAGIPIELKKHPFIEWPEHLEAFTFPQGNIQHFKQPRRLVDGSSFNYYCLDAASLLPVLMLDIKQGDSILDMCAGPGGKSLVAMQTLRPGQLLCNDVDKTRVKRIMNVMGSYLKDFNKDLGQDVIQYKQCDASKLGDWMPDSFDLVLCDVPCYTDRHIVQYDEGSLFHSSRTKERLRLPQYQSDLLRSALLCVKPGGSVVYSTCSLSPVQNDGVVYSALKTIWEDTRMEFSVSDLSLAVRPFSSMMKFGDKKLGLRYGQLVIPCLTNNFGPMYFSKINKIK